MSISSLKRRYLSHLLLFGHAFSITKVNFIIKLNFHGLDVLKMRQSDLYEDSMTLKEASDNFVNECKRIDKGLNSPVRSKYLSQNYLENYLMVEGICRNLQISHALTQVSFCGLRLSLESMLALNETLLTNKLLKTLAFNYCLLDASHIEALMPALCQNTCLETFDLSCNSLTDEISYLIAKIISA